jgi:hypothetical protein
MYAVGSGTRTEHVQAMAGLDDSFEFFGGAADARYLVSYEAGDDHFDWSEGFSGRLQYLIAFQTGFLEPRNGAGTTSTDPRGFEGDGCENNKPGCTYANAPYSMPVFANFTLIGPGTGGYGSITDGNGMVVRRGSGGSFINGVIARWPGNAISVRDAESGALMTLDSLMVRNVTFADNGGTFDNGNGGFTLNLDVPANNITASASGAAALFTSLTPSSLDFTPSATASIRTAGTTTLPAKILARGGNFFGGALAGTAYQGAADPNAATKWWAGWTKYAKN